MKITTWLFDFDDTLASAPVTWALNAAIPKLIERHALPVEAAKLNRALLIAQSQWSQTDNFMPILSNLFEEMGWSSDLQSELLVDLQTSYRPTLFDDALDLLRRMAQAGHLAYIVSNNALAPDTARQLGITPYVRDIFTPDRFPDALPKPSPTFWTAILNRYPVLEKTSPVLIGDDPWTDGAFAEACGMPCWIVDRSGRMESLYDSKPYRWIRSLRDIPLT